MATYRLDTDEHGELTLIEEENGTFQTPVELLNWEAAEDRHVMGQAQRGSML
ncbi:MAG: hypothetical protein AAGJ52_00885 [Pseudomonadota bacterium]